MSVKFTPMTTAKGDIVDNLEVAIDENYIYVRCNRNVEARKSKTGKSYVLGATAGVPIEGVGDAGAYFRGTFGLQLTAAEKKVATIEAKRAELAALEADLAK